MMRRPFTRIAPTRGLGDASPRPFSARSSSRPASRLSNGVQVPFVFDTVVGLCGVDALVLTKLDGTAKGGIALAIAHELNLPIAWVGVGEKLEDLLPFDAAAFVEGLWEAA